MTFKIRDRPNHPIVKALRKANGNKYDESELVYMPRFSQDWGWLIDGYFIAYNRQGAITAIKHNKLPI